MGTRRRKGWLRTGRRAGETRRKETRSRRAGGPWAVSRWKGREKHEKKVSKGEGERRDQRPLKGSEQG